MKVRIATHDFYWQVERLMERLYTDLDYGIFSGSEADIDLIVFSGGADISPSLYGEKNYASYVNPHRDSVEQDVYKFAGGNIPVFGICRGHQLLNALAGGKLTQNIRRPHGSRHYLDNGLVVNSYHHQGVIETPLEIVASYDGVAEITQGMNIFSVQFHPEFEVDHEMDWMVLKGLTKLCP